MEHVTFSDNVKSSEDFTLPIDQSTGAPILSLEEYCRKNPSALECREYDV
jgi:hypothetical protein